MKTLVTAACVATLTFSTTFAAFAEIRTEPGEWRPDNAEVLQDRYGCDPDEWTRAISETTGETLYSNNWTCKPGRVTPRGSTNSQQLKPCIYNNARAPLNLPKSPFTLAFDECEPPSPPPCGVVNRAPLLPTSPFADGLLQKVCS